MELVTVALGLTIGAIVGSFLAALALRWGRGDSVLRGRSHCDGCGVRIGARDLVPVSSYLLLRGRCRACGVAIDLRQPMMEGGCALIGGLALALHPGAEGWAGALFGWLLATLALLDFDHFWLPDRLVLPLGLIGLLCGFIGIFPSWQDRLIGAAFGFALLAAIRWAYRRLRGREGLGGGDAKLLAAIGAWLGWQTLPSVLLLAALAGLGWALFLALRGNAVSRTTRLPFGTLLAIAAWPLWLATQPLS
jgi:leader peptidase (prepilin peptidase) / N-methyltransferase